jgi:predicted acyltransferase
VSQAESSSLRRSLRLESVDVLRGLTVGGMILVNQAGDFRFVYHHLDHAPWDGLTAADLIFPSFVFVMGVSIALALGGPRARGERLGAHAGRIARRALLLVGVGLLLNLFPYFDLATVRIPGVLQRLGVAYAAAAVVFLTFPRVRQQLTVAVTLTLLYEVLLTFASVGGGPSGLRSRDENFAGQFDRLVFGAHRFTPEWDPEGLLGTLPTITTALLGVVAARWMAYQRDPIRRVAYLFTSGLAAFTLGLALHGVIPLNKNLWSASFVVATAGASAMGLALAHALVDLRGVRRPFAPFRALGLNALAIYVLSSLVISALHAIELGSEGGAPLTLQDWIFRTLFLPLAPPHAASLLFALVFLAIWIGVAMLLDRKRIYVRL